MIWGTLTFLVEVASSSFSELQPRAFAGPFKENFVWKLTFLRMYFMNFGSKIKRQEKSNLLKWTFNWSRALEFSSFSSLVRVQNEFSPIDRGSIWEKMNAFSQTYCQDKVLDRKRKKIQILWKDISVKNKKIFFFCLVKLFTMWVSWLEIYEE